MPMRRPTTRLSLRLLCVLATLPFAATLGATQAAHSLCSRPAPGSSVVEPAQLRSRDGVLRVDLTLRDERESDGAVRYCYLSADGAQSPTLRVKPGDWLILRLHNALTQLETGSAGSAAASGHRMTPGRADPCTSGMMTSVSTNLHFHGLTVPPLCHQDDVLSTSIQPRDPPFEYRFRIPADEPPGLYWYHPHIHGFSTRQVLGGASGALIVEGIERATPELAGLPERVLVVRDQDLLNPDAPPSPGEPAAQALIDRDGDAANTGTGTGKPAKDLSVNYVPVPYPDYPHALVTIRPGERQLWRVLNASSVTYLNLALLYKRGAHFRAEWFGVVDIDGVPLSTSGAHGHAIEWRDGVVVPPGARVEFVLNGPPLGVPAMLVTRAVNTGEGGENDPNRALLSLAAAPDAAEPRSRLPAAPETALAPALPWLGDVPPTRVRKLYFSEYTPDPKNPGDTRFYLTVDGQTPATFDMSATVPNILVRQGEVEDWIIENRSSELHTF